MTEGLLPRPPIEVVRAGALEGLTVLLKKVQEGKQEELQSKRQRNDLENAVANMLFVNSEVTPIVREFFQRRHIRIDFEITRTGFWDRFMSGLEGYTSSMIQYNSEDFELGIPWGRISLEGEEMPRLVQAEWDKGYETVRRMLREFGSLTKEQIVGRFGQTVEYFE